LSSENNVNETNQAPLKHTIDEQVGRDDFRAKRADFVVLYGSCFSTESQDAINPSYFTWFWEPVCFVLSPQDQRRTDCALATQVAWFYFALIAMQEKSKLIAN